VPDRAAKAQGTHPELELSRRIPTSFFGPGRSLCSAPCNTDPSQDIVPATKARYRQPSRGILSGPPWARNPRRHARIAGLHVRIASADGIATPRRQDCAHTRDSTGCGISHGEEAGANAPIEKHVEKDQMIIGQPGSLGAKRQIAHVFLRREPRSSTIGSPGAEQLLGISTVTAMRNAVNHLPNAILML